METICRWMDNKCRSLHHKLVPKYLSVPVVLPTVPVMSRISFSVRFCDTYMFLAWRSGGTCTNRSKLSSEPVDKITGCSSHRPTPRRPLRMQVIPWPFSTTKTLTAGTPRYYGACSREEDYRKRMWRSSSDSTFTNGTPHTASGPNVDIDDARTTVQQSCFDYSAGIFSKSCKSCTDGDNKVATVFNSAIEPARCQVVTFFFATATMSYALGDGLDEPRYFAQRWKDFILQSKLSR